MALAAINVKKQRAEHTNEEIHPIGWLRVTH